MDYATFLESKLQLGAQHGFEPVFMPGFLFDFQQALVDWSVRKGRAGIFADCGLGKSPMALSWAENIVRYTNRRVLILTPLAVGAQMLAEAGKFGFEAHRSAEGTAHPHITITNYERLHYFNPSDYAGVVCDEASVLKSFDGTRRALITEFLRTVPYRLLCTATAAPNDYVELGTSSEALGDLGHIDMLNRFFRNELNNSAMGRGYLGADNRWRFKPHAEQPFWRWVCSWARAIRKPSDLGCGDRRFTLPPLVERETVVTARVPRPGYLFDLPALGFHEVREVRRRTIQERCEMAAEKVDGTGESAVIWCLKPDAPVVLANGTEAPVALIEPGALVISGRGRPRRVLRCYQRPFTGDMVRIQVRGLCDALELTPEHKVPTTAGWKPASEIRVGDELIEPRLGFLGEGDYDAGYLVGLYAAQGNRVRGPRNTWNRIDLTVHEDKSASIAERVQSFCRGRVQIRKTPGSGHSDLITVSDQRLRDLVDGWVEGDSALNKRLTELPSEREFAKGILDAWLEEDGWRQGKARIGQTSSRNLARQMYSIAVALGFASSMTTGQNRPGPRARLEGIPGTAHQWWRIGVSEYVGYYAQATLIGNSICREVVKVSRVPYTGEVHDLEVEEDHTFLASGITVSNCHLNAEGDLLERLIPDALQVSGTDSDESKEEKFASFKSGETRVLIIKPVIGAWGLNWEHCAHVVYFPSYSYEQYYQAVRRCWRFGQTRPVVVDLVRTDGDEAVLAALQRKAAAADKMFSDLVAHMNNAMTIDRDRSFNRTEEVPPWLSQSNSSPIIMQSTWATAAR